MMSLPDRLDAGSFGTMGVGLGFAVAAGIWCKDHALGSGVRITPQGRGSFPFRETARLAFLEWKLRQFVGKYIYSVLVKGKGGGQVLSLRKFTDASRDFSTKMGHGNEF